jgi:hypothetical protein
MTRNRPSSRGIEHSTAFLSVYICPGRILKGEMPADLPVQQATNVELFIDLKIAKSLGLTVPLSLRSAAVLGTPRHGNCQGSSASFVQSWPDLPKLRVLRSLLSACDNG